MEKDAAGGCGYVFDVAGFGYYASDYDDRDDEYVDYDGQRYSWT